MDRRSFFLAAGALALPLVTRAQRSPATLADAGISCGMAPNGVRVCTVGIQVFQAQKFAQQQYQSQWCWAACISMIFAHYGHPVSQARIVADAYGGIRNFPGTVNAILGSLNRSWLDDYGSPFTVQASPTGNYLSAITDLRDDHPQLIGSLGHAVVLTAMTFYDTPSGPQVVDAIVRDPWPASPSRRQMTAAEWYNVALAAQIRVT